MGCQLEVRHDWKTDENKLSVSARLSLDMYLLCLNYFERIGIYITAYFGKYYFVMVKVTKRLISNEHKSDEM